MVRLLPTLRKFLGCGRLPNVELLKSYVRNCPAYIDPSPANDNLFLSRGGEASVMFESLAVAFPPVIVISGFASTISLSSGLSALL